LLSFPPFIAWLQPSPIPAFIPTSFSTPIITDIFPSSLTSTPTSTATNTPTFTPTDTPTATLTEAPTSTPGNVMVVILTASRNTGRPSLTVKFDARESYLREPSGKHLSCRGGPCFYTWRVFSGGSQIGGSDNNSSGTFDYNFSKNGSYRVTVWICRGKDRIDCEGSGVQIEVTR